MNTTSSLLLYFDQAYLKDYFLKVAGYLNRRFPGKVTLASPFDVGKQDVPTACFNKTELANAPHSHVWTTADLLHLVSPAAYKMATFHHAGYGENLFIPNTSALRYANLIMCCTFQPSGKLPGEAFTPLITEQHRKEMVIAPVGYPKFDLCWEACQRNQNKDSAMICLTDINDIHYNVMPQLYKSIECLLEQTTQHVVIRPFPRDLTHPDIVTLVKHFESNPRFRVSRGSYIDDFSRSAFMVFFGRQDATTAYTFAYSTEVPVLFVEPHIENSLEERDIGYSIRDSDFIASGLCAIRKDNALERILATRKSSIEYVGGSLERIATVINKVCFDADELINNFYPFTLQNKTLDINKALSTLELLADVVAKNAVQNGSGYIIADWFNYYLTNTSNETLATKYEAYFSFVINAQSHLHPHIFIRMLISLLNRADAIGVRLNIDTKHHIDELATSKYSEIAAPSESFNLLGLQLFMKLNNPVVARKLASSLTESVNPKVLLALIQWSARDEHDRYAEFVVRYLQNVGHWDLNKLALISAKNNYSLFGLGNSTRFLIVYMKQHLLTLPQYVYGDSCDMNEIEGVQVRDIDEYQEETDILIVSPGGYESIAARLIESGVDQRRLLRIT